MEKIERIADHIIQNSFLFLAFFIPLFFTPVNHELFEFNKMMATYGITAIILAAWVSKMIAQKRLSIAKTPFNIPIGLFVLSQIVSALFSMDPHVSWFGYYSRFNGGVLSIISYAILFFAFVTNIKKEQLRKLIYVTLGSAAIVAIYGVAEHFGIDKSLWVQDVQNRVFSTLGQPNWLAAYLLPLIPMTMALTITAHHGKRTMRTIIVYTILNVLYFTVLLFTRSRSGLLALACIDILFWIWIFFRSRIPGSATVERQKNWLIPFVVIHVIFFLIVTVYGTHIETIDRFVTYTGIKNQIVKPKQTNPQPAAEQPTGPVLETGGTDSGVIRTYVWLAAIRAWRSSPKTMIIGTGTETFAFAFYQYKPIAHNLTSEWDFLYNKAHNEYLNYLTTTGIFGLGSYLVFLGSIIWWFLKQLRRGFVLMAKPDKPSTKKSSRHQLATASNIMAQTISSDTHILLFGIGLGWVSILITNFFGFSVVIIQLLLFLLPAAAYLLSLGENDDRRISRNLSLSPVMQNIIFIVTSLLLVSILGYLVIVWNADKTYESGYRDERTGNYAKAYTPLSVATHMIPDEPLYHDDYATTLATLAVAAMENEDATLAATLASHAIAENDASLTISPNNVSYWKTRTKIFYALSTIDERMISYAIQSLEKAQTLSPFDPKIVYNLAILVGKTGDTDKAITYLIQAKALKTNYRDAYYALYVFYQDKGQKTQATDVINQYLTNVDSQDQDFKKLVQ